MLMSLCCKCDWTSKKSEDVTANCPVHAARSSMNASENGNQQLLLQEHKLQQQQQLQASEQESNIESSSFTNSCIIEEVQEIPIKTIK